MSPGDRPPCPIPVDGQVLECVINVSEGRRSALVAAAGRGGGPPCPGHPLRCRPQPVGADPRRPGRGSGGGGPPGGRGGGGAARPAHPSGGPPPDRDAGRGAVRGPGPGGPGGNLVDGPIEAAVAARDRFAAWAGSALDLPCFLYGPERSLPDVRRQAWSSLVPDHGPPSPHPGAGAVAVGARPVLVAYNLWLRPARPASAIWPGDGRPPSAAPGCGRWACRWPAQCRSRATSSILGGSTRSGLRPGGRSAPTGSGPSTTSRAGRV